VNNKQDILNELKTISHLLLSLKEKEKELVIPAHYFEDLSDILLLQTKEESAVLSALKKEKPQVPDSYFENFGDTVLSKIKPEENGKEIKLPKSQNKIFNLFSKIAFAASIVGAIFFIKQGVQPTINENNCEDGIACLTQDEIYNYMNANSHEFETEDVQETVQSVIEITESKVDAEKKEVEQYIESNKIILDADDASTDIF
jgi:ATP-dependent helicase YprA (DUF1998 family)